MARGAVAALLALAVAASASAVVAVRRADEARRQERTATSRLLAAARNELEGRLDRALLLGAEALRLERTGESRNALVTALQHDPDAGPMCGRTRVWTRSHSARTGS